MEIVVGIIGMVIIVGIAIGINYYKGEYLSLIHI